MPVKLYSCPGPLIRSASLVLLVSDKPRFVVDRAEVSRRDASRVCPLAPYSLGWHPNRDTTMTPRPVLRTGSRMMAAMVPPVASNMEATDPSPILKVVRQVAANKTKVLSLAQGTIFTGWNCYQR